ncbi:MAG: four helix bundle protein [Marinilabiliaceae bacterium]|nr:four helix bundle protein [Marinilabiliaceae bacterium]
MHYYSFEKLEIWQLSRNLVKEIYTTTDSFPQSEQFGLVSQIRRASVSISSNIAEGNGRHNKKDKA